MTYRVFIGALALSTGIACTATAEDTEAPRCEMKGENGMVTLLLCPEGLKMEELAQEGRLACGDRKPCGAWVWTDAANVPEEAPDSHDKLPPESIKAASAIWVNEDEKLITLEKQ